MYFNKCFNPTDILIPKAKYLNKWSVVACDQFTSQEDYWEETKKTVSENVSTLNIIFPEIYLENDGFDSRIENINKTMENYLSADIFNSFKNSLILTVRETKNKKNRIGIIGSVDLECYDYKKGSKTPIRATEGTVLERIPPRVKIRENACLEVPHIMLLIDDDKKIIIEPVYENISSLEKIYDFDLMQNGGHISGYLINPELTEEVINKLNLFDENSFKKKYSVKDNSVLQYAVGDGNHSLATAKKCYEDLKAKIGKEKALLSKSRYALVELVNLHCDALEFEPIHRVLFNVDFSDFKTQMKTFFKDQEISFSDKETTSNHQIFSCIHGDKTEVISIKNPVLSLTVASVQSFLDEFIINNSTKIDYIHGVDVVKKLCKENNNIGIILPDFKKSDLFKTVINDGALPRKTFSMGEACEKRYYLETRKIK